MTRYIAPRLVAAMLIATVGLVGCDKTESKAPPASPTVPPPPGSGKVPPGTTSNQGSGTTKGSSTVGGPAGGFKQGE